MANSLMGLNNYYNTFISPVKPYQVNPVTNLMYGAAASKAYSQTAAKKLSSTVSSYLTSISNTITDVKTAAKSIASKGPDSSFNKKAAASTDAAAVTGTAAPNANSAEYTVKVSKIATNQANEGANLNSDTQSAFSAGLNTFTLRAGSVEKTISFNVKAGDSNKNSLSNMASAVNSAKAGVTASVVSDSKTGMSFLRLTGDKTGSNNGFSLTDITGNSAALSGANTVKTQAADAKYTVDGKEYTSHDNDVSLDNGKVTLKLNGATGKDTKVTVGTDTKAIEGDVRQLVESYNSLMDLANSRSGDFSGAARLSREFGNIVNSKKHPLENIGINVNQDGTLAIDDTKLKDSISHNLSRVKDTLGGYNGIGQKVLSKGNEVLANPVKYSNPGNSYIQQFSSSYSNPQAANQLPSSQNLNSGLLFDMLL